MVLRLSTYALRLTPGLPVSPVPKRGLEPPRDCSHYALNVACLPFHHFGAPPRPQHSRLGDEHSIQEHQSTPSGAARQEFSARRQPPSTPPAELFPVDLLLH
jgi:hypothetical protein